MNRIATSLALSLSFLLIALAGCNRGPQLAKVVGTVTYKGKPVAGAHLMFVTAVGRPGFADVDEKGHFEAFTVSPGDGVLVGEQVVTLSPHFNVVGNAQQSRNAPGDGGPIASQPLTQSWPDKYRSATTSPLKIVVEPGKVNEFNFNLED